MSDMVERLGRAVATFQGSGERLYDPAQLQPLIARFQQQYPNFTSQAYVDEERAYKLLAAERMRGLIGEERLRDMIERSDFEGAKRAILQACQGLFTLPTGEKQRNNLLNQWDLRPISEAPAEPLARRLYALLYDEDSATFATRFNALVDLLSATKPGVWQPVTYFLMLHDPSRHILVKPTQFEPVLTALLSKQEWQTKPDAAHYAWLQRFSAQLLADLQPLGARDMIDVQSFLWRLLYTPESKTWVFQSNPRYYDLDGALATFDELYWLVNQHAQQIQRGDTVYLWEAGNNAGVAAVARVLEPPAEVAGEQIDMRFYRDPSRFAGTQLRARLQIEQVLPERLRRDSLREHPVLQNIAPLRQPHATNFILTTEQAKALNDLVQDILLDDGDDDNDVEANDLATWQANIVTKHPLTKRVVTEYPSWLTTTFGNRIEFRPLDSQRFSVHFEHRRIQRGRFNQSDGVYVWFQGPGDAVVALLRQQLSQPDTVQPRQRKGAHGYRCILYTDADYRLLQEITRQMIEDTALDWPPVPLDGPAFVLIHGGNSPEQTYGSSYSFTNEAGGAPRQLANALAAFRMGGPAVYAIIYRPGPFRAYTAWAHVVDFTEETADGVTRWTLQLDQHEFPFPVDPRPLGDRIAWLRKGLGVAVRGFSIRQITADEFNIIIDAARAVASGEKSMSMTDAAHTILVRAGGGPLHLTDILAQAQDEGLIETTGQTPQLSLSSALLRDPRFSNLGRNMWVLTAEDDNGELVEAAYPPPDLVLPKLFAGPEANFWRIHLPPALWNDARESGVVGIGFADNPTNQSVQRFKRIKVGDRVVMYMPGGLIGGVGVVTWPYDEDAPRGDDALFGGKYHRRIGVAWGDKPVEPLPLPDALREPALTPLYNRLRNTMTVMPLSRDDYAVLLAVLGFDDVGDIATRLPSAWTTLRAYLDFVRLLDTNPDADAYTPAALLGLAHGFGRGFNGALDEDELVDDLRQLRLIESRGELFVPHAYVVGDDTALLRLMALALLIPVEGSVDSYTLPSRTLLPTLLTANGPQPLERFASEYGADGPQLLAWYAEAGFVTVNDDNWQTSADADEPLPSTGTTATDEYNRFLQTLRADLDRTLVTDMPHADGALPPSPDLADRLRELGQAVLIDPQIVKRIYRSLMAGRHVVLSGPPGTGKTELARLLPTLLWREAPQTFTRLTTSLDAPPTQQSTEERHGYYPDIVTATEDWGVRDVVGGIGPRLDADSDKLGYTIEYGALTGAVLRHYEGSDGKRPVLTDTRALQRRDYLHEQRTRYRGVWLVIDEFTRAPVDAAFGGLLTTLSGGKDARLAVPVAGGEQREVALPPDFRIIATLNSFDRHFLNQISEAIKRRFDFIDVPPPRPQLAAYERGVAAKQALERLRANGIDPIIVEDDPPYFAWPELLTVFPTTDVEGMRRYELDVHDTNADAALRDFWNLFSAIRVFRQLGTAQVIACYTNMFAGVLISAMNWPEALDTALADSLADQLQVLNRDEQQLLEDYLDHAGNADAFAAAVNKRLKNVSGGRLRGLLHALREAEQLRHGTSSISLDAKQLDAQQLGQVFELGNSIDLSAPSIFRARLRDLIGERGL
jgi:5-methylcytosine-specific restriction enzyme B